MKTIRSVNLSHDVYIKLSRIRLDLANEDEAIPGFDDAIMFLINNQKKEYHDLPTC